MYLNKFKDQTLILCGDFNFVEEILIELMEKLLMTML